MSIRRVVPNIRSEHFDKNQEFYGNFLGFQVVMDLDWIMTLVSPTNPTAQISIIRRDQSAPVDPNLTVEVSDVDAVYSIAVERGLKIVYPLTGEPWGVRRFFIEDPNGQIVNIMSHPE